MPSGQQKYFYWSRQAWFKIDVKGCDKQVLLNIKDHPETDSDAETELALRWS